LGVFLSYAGLPAEADIQSQVREATAGFRDVSLTARITYKNNAELDKVSTDFAKGYQLKTSTVTFKQPDKMKVEGKLGLFKVAMIINGDRKAFSIPSIHFTDRENIKGKPHQRQTDLDIGILTCSLWNDYIVTEATTEKGSDGEVYKLVFVRSNAKNKSIACWADAKTLKILKVDKYAVNGSMKSRYIYSNHREFNGIWVPGKIDVYSQDGKLAATTVYDNIRVNTGVSDSAFKIP